MKKFKVLWVDDEEDNISVMKGYLEEWVTNQTAGEYSLLIDEKRTYDEGIVGVANDPMINMIISDLNLLDEKSGAEMLTLIQQNEIYKEMLLYSSNSKALQKAIQDLDGIYSYSFTDIYKLRDKIRNIIHQSLFREQYAHTRYEEYKKLQDQLKK